MCFFIFKKPVSLSHTALLPSFIHCAVLVHLSCTELLFYIGDTVLVCGDIVMKQAAIEAIKRLHPSTLTCVKFMLIFYLAFFMCVF